jgi:hypothetical protein
MWFNNNRRLSCLEYSVGLEIENRHNFGSVQFSLFNYIAFRWCELCPGYDNEVSLRSQQFSLIILCSLLTAAKETTNFYKMCLLFTIIIMPSACQHIQRVTSKELLPIWRHNDVRGKLITDGQLMNIIQSARVSDFSCVWLSVDDELREQTTPHDETIPSVLNSRTHDSFWMLETIPSVVNSRTVLESTWHVVMLHD